MKRLIYSLMVLTALTLLTLGCQHEDGEIIPTKGPDINHGTETVSCIACTPLLSNGASADFNSGNVPAEVWYFDKAHSNVQWETAYREFGSLLTGRFNYFVLEDLNFDEANPANISFEGYIRLNSVNTGEPGRDGGCLLSTFLTSIDATSESTNLASLVSLPNSGRYSSTDEGFIVDADFTFLGVTHEVTVKIFYYPNSDQGTYNMVGLSGEFGFRALTDFAVSSSNIRDDVKVKMNLILKNKKP